MEEICRESEFKVIAYATMLQMTPQKSGHGGYALDLRAHELLRAGHPVKLERIPMALLFLLVERKGQLVTRQEIVEKLWGKDRFLDVDNSINTAIRKLRHAFEDDPLSPVFIQTHPGAGYRFIGEIAVSGGVSITAGRRIMLAVLPFEDLSEDREHEYFSDGLTEETIAILGQVHPNQLGLIARTSIMAYKRTAKTISEIGRELGVDYILESSVRREGKRVRIACQLILVHDQTHLWANVFERDLSGILSLQVELGKLIAGHVQIHLDHEAVFEQQYAPVLDAYDLCLQGRHHFNRFNHRQALACFQKAVERDPHYAPSYSGLANSYFGLTLAVDEPTLDLLPQALSAAERSLQLNSGLAEGHNAMGLIKMWFEWDWPRAIASFQRAIELNLSSVHAHLNYGHLLSNLGKNGEAMREIEIARQLDPLSPMVSVFEGIFRYHAREFDGAAESLAKAMALNPHLWLPYLFQGKVLERQGKAAEAMAAFERSLEIVGDNTELISLKGYLLATQGRRTEAEHTLELLVKQSRQRYVPPYNIALIYAGLSNAETALDYLERAFEMRDARATFLAVEPKWDPMRKHPRFQDLLRRMSLPSIPGFAGFS